MAKEASTVWKKYGALDYKECVIDDATPPGVVRTFAKMAKPKKGEEVWFSYVVYKSRAHRDAVNKKVMAYFEKKYDDKSMNEMPFDMKRMAYGGFEVAVGI
jgi:alkaline phosphatase